MERQHALSLFHQPAIAYRRRIGLAAQTDTPRRRTGCDNDGFAVGVKNSTGVVRDDKVQGTAADKECRRVPLCPQGTAVKVDLRARAIIFGDQPGFDHAVPFDRKRRREHVRRREVCREIPCQFDNICGEQPRHRYVAPCRSLTPRHAIAGDTETTGGHADLRPGRNGHAADGARVADHEVS